jgi:hypothetical protein
MADGNPMIRLGYSLLLIKLCTGNSKINQRQYFMELIILLHFMIFTSIRTSPNRILALHISGEVSNLPKEYPHKVQKLKNTSLGQQIRSLKQRKLKSIKCISFEVFTLYFVYYLRNALVYTLNL